VGVDLRAQSKQQGVEVKSIALRLHNPIQVELEVRKTLLNICQMRSPKDDRKPLRPYKIAIQIIYAKVGTS